MSLPNPTFLTNEYITLYGTTQYPALVISTSGGNKVLIPWGDLDLLSKTSLYNLIMAYAAENSTAESSALTIPATAAWVTLDFGGTVVGANPTNLPSTSATFVINVDGVAKTVIASSSNAATFTTLLSVINTALGASAAASIVGGNIKIVSATTGNASSISFGESSLLWALSGFVSTGTRYAGAANLTGVFTNNKLLGETYWDAYSTIIRTVPATPLSPPGSSVSGSVTVANFPATQIVSGTVAVSAIAGTVTTHESSLTLLGYQQITTLTASQTLTVPTGATKALIQAEGDNIRWRDDGTAPTASVGMRLLQNNDIMYTGNLAAIKLIQEVSGGKLNISYYS